MTMRKCDGYLSLEPRDEGFVYLDRPQAFRLLGDFYPEKCLRSSGTWLNFARAYVKFLAKRIHSDILQELPQRAEGIIGGPPSF